MTPTQVATLHSTAVRVRVATSGIRAAELQDSVTASQELTETLVAAGHDPEVAARIADRWVAATYRFAVACADAREAADELYPVIQEMTKALHKVEQE